MASFTEDSRAFFFGREKETEELVRLIRRNTLTVLFGQSGLGKSSLLQAGAFPVLRNADFLPLYLRLDHAPESPPLAEQ
ncbi:MAG: ATP-binding protein, partial [Verrucomicrobia bacterium]|nr:ATP-binding protein [Verrucomicrobiota bacterium]